MSSIPESDASHELRWPAGKPESDLAVPACGAPDPYVNLPENNHMQSDINVAQSLPVALPHSQTGNDPFDATVALEQALRKLENFQSQLDENEEGIDACEQSDAKSTLDNLKLELAQKQANAESRPAPNSNFEEPIVADSPADEDLEFEAEFDRHVFGSGEDDLALDLEAFEGLTENAEATSLDTTQTPAFAPHYTEPTGDPSKIIQPVFDVRDFLDASQAKPEPIPGAYHVDPYFYDFKTADEITDATDLSQLNAVPSFETVATPITTTEGIAATKKATVSTQDTALIEPAKDDQLFVANTGDVIQIDGSDGFDHIDLACFDVEHANIVNDVIFVDDKAGTAFEIRFRNVDYVLFSNGNTVDLTNG